MLGPLIKMLVVFSSMMSYEDPDYYSLVELRREHYKEMHLLQQEIEKLAIEEKKITNMTGGVNKSTYENEKELVYTIEKSKRFAIEENEKKLNNKISKLNGPGNFELLLQKAIAESNKFSKVLTTKNGLSKKQNICLAKALANILYFINEKSEINTEEWTEHIDDFLRNYHKSFEHYKKADKETRDEIDNNYKPGEQLSFDLFKAGMDEIFTGKKIIVIIRTYNLCDKKYIVECKEVGDGELIGNLFVLLSSTIKDDERQGGHFETFKSKLNINDITQKFETNKRTFDILKKIAI